MAVTRHTACEGISEVVGAVALHFHTHRFSKGDAKGLGTLLKHAHQFFGIFEVVVHEHPIVEMGRLFNLFVDATEVVAILYRN